MLRIDIDTALISYLRADRNAREKGVEDTDGEPCAASSCVGHMYWEHSEAEESRNEDD